MMLRSAFLSLLIVVFAPGALLAQGAGHVVTGVVRDETSNSPLSAVTVQLLSSVGEVETPVTSGMDGEFTFTGVSDGDYSIVATKFGYETSTESITVTRTNTLPVTISLRSIASPKTDQTAGPVSARDLSVPDKARTAFDRGRKLLEQENKPADSLPEFQRAVDAFPGYYEAYTEMGLANMRLGKTPDAEQALKKAIDLSAGKFPNPLYLLADIYNIQRNYEEAASLARQVIGLEDDAWNGHFELARAFVGMGAGPEAEICAMRAKELNPRIASVNLVLADAHLLDQNFAAAIQDYDAYLQLEPNGNMSDVVRQNRDKLQKQLQQAPAANQGSPPPATPKP